MEPQPAEAEAEAAAEAEPTHWPRLEERRMPLVQGTLGPSPYAEGLEPPARVWYLTVKGRVHERTGVRGELSKHLVLRLRESMNLI